MKPYKPPLIILSIITLGCTPPLQTTTQKLIETKECTGCDLREAKLNSAQLAGANLNRADLANAQMTNTNLAGVQLKSADLFNANLSNANLESIN
jgi:uncharacterized protein YjbI with pentapeptide repeats